MVVSTVIVHRCIRQLEDSVSNHVEGIHRCLDALTRSICYNRIGHSWFVGGKHESGPSIEIGLCIYGLLKDNVIMPKVGA